ncbi:MAG: glycosyl transferase [Leptolyngbyaceae cyanobacterium SL_7_1]|nr:glycosyl transferase [Leptolyngbyaceae cyanobacterium SL_7_1]
MITVTLGTIPYSFERTIAWLNALLDRKVINEPIFVQYGITDISPIASHPLVTAQSIVESTELLALVKRSRLILSHAGQGSTRMLAAEGASFVLIPRLSRYKEHVDDHQLLFAQNVQHFGVRYCLHLKEVEDAILHPPPPFQGQLFSGPKLPDYLRSLYAQRSYPQRLKR